jgi:CRISPR-associated protein Cas1
MYLRRFAEPPPGALTLERLRGAEGARMRTLYRSLAATHRVPGFKRRYDPAQFDAADPVNRALSTANTCLYGVCLAAVVSIGAVPQLGFVHTGTAMAFVYDIADLYKAETSIPAAFTLARSDDPETAARRVMRRRFRETKLLRRVVGDVTSLLAGGLDPNERDGNQLAGEAGLVPGGRNWHRIVGDRPRVDIDDEWDAFEFGGTTETP